MRDAAQLFQTVLADLFGGQPSFGWSPDLGPRDVAIRLLSRDVVRKFEGAGDIPQTAVSSAISKFLEANQRCREFEWMALANTSLDEMLIGEFCSQIHHFFASSNDSAIISDNTYEHFMLGRPGPGASVGTRHTDLLHKMFDSAVSVTSGLLPFWEYCTTSGFSEPLTNAFFFARESHGLTVVDTSNVSVVPKTVDIGRTIATEPSANMWMQRGFSAQIEHGLKRYFGIDLATQQDKNRLLARYGSSRDDLVTLDLESASDSISLNLIRASFPQWVVRLLETYRSPACCIRREDMPPAFQGGTSDPGLHALDLHMVSTMGNGFTFSLMTLIMACVVNAVGKLSGVPLTRWAQVAGVMKIADDDLPVAPGNWGVFGDDIICPKSISARVIRLLSLLGFRVNHSKSFVEGPFRESCGGDYFRGVDVRPVYIKHLETRADLFVAFNSLAAWSSLHGVALSRTLKLLLKWLGRQDRTLVPLHCNDDEGIKVPRSLVACRPNHPVDANGAIWYRKWTPVPSVLIIVQSGARLRTRGKRSRCRNTWGISSALLAGTICGGIVSIRVDRSQLRYRTIRLVSPSWDTRCRRVGRDCAPLEWLVTTLGPLLN